MYELVISCTGFFKGYILYKNKNSDKVVEIILDVSYETESD